MAEIVEATDKCVVLSVTAEEHVMLANGLLSLIKSSCDALELVYNDECADALSNSIKKYKELLDSITL